VEATRIADSRAVRAVIFSLAITSVCVFGIGGPLGLHWSYGMRRLAFIAGVVVAVLAAALIARGYAFQQVHLLGASARSFGLDGFG